MGGLGLDKAGWGAVVVLGLVPIHWWVKLGPGASAGPLVGRGRSEGLGLQGPGGPGTGVGPLVDGAEAQGVLGLVPPQW